MCKSSNKILSGLDFLLQPGNIVLQCIGHPVKIHRQLPQLIIADLSRPIIILSLCHPPGRPGQKPDRPGQPGRNTVHNERAKHQHEHGHPPVNQKSQRPLTKHSGHIPHGFQV